MLERADEHLYYNSALQNLDFSNEALVAAKWHELRNTGRSDADIEVQIRERLAKLIPNEKELNAALDRINAQSQEFTNSLS